MKFKHLFLPTPENDYTPHLLQKAAIGIMMFLVLLSFVAVNTQALLWQSSHWLVGTVLPAVVVDITNSQRKVLNEKPLQRNSLLDKAAILKAEDMAKHGYFAHYSPEGVSPWHWFNEVSYVYAHAGENLAVHFKDSGAVVDAWMKSPAHRANIVDNSYTEIGVGTAKGYFEGYETVFVVQLFGTPGIPQPPAPVVIPIVDYQQVVAEEVSIIESGTTTLITNDTEFLTDELITEQVAGEEVFQAIALEEKDKTSLEFTQIENVQEIEADVAEVVSDNTQTSIFSTHFSTTSGLMPLNIESMSGTTAHKVSVLGSIATRPSELLQFLYLILGTFVAGLLLISIFVGFKNHRPLQVVYGLSLMIVMSALFYVHISLTTNVVIASELTTESQNL